MNTRDNLIPALQRALNEKFLELLENNSQSAQVESKMTAYFKAEFDKAKAEDESKKLYTALAMLVHPDKLVHKFNNNIYQYLAANACLQKPQQRLRACYEERKAEILKQKIDGHLPDDPSIKNFIFALYSEVYWLFYMLFSMYDNLARYSKPVEVITKGILVLAYFAFGVLTLPFTLGAFVVLPLKWGLSLLTNLMTTGIFEKNFIATKETMPTFKILKKDIGEDYLQDMNFVDEMTIFGMQKLKIISSSLYAKLTQPLPEGIGSKFKVIASWPFKLLAASLLAAAAIALEVSYFVLLIPPHVSIFVGCGATLLLCNLPLYIKNVAAKFWQGLKSVFGSSAHKEDECKQDAEPATYHPSQNIQQKLAIGAKELNLSPRPSLTGTSVHVGGRQGYSEEVSSSDTVNKVSFDLPIRDEESVSMNGILKCRS